MKYKKVLAALIIFTISITTNSYAQQKSEVIKRKETFQVIPSATVEINNKYGNIHIGTWNKDSARIEINFYISEKNENRFNKIKNNVDFKITGNSSYLIAETVFGSNYSSWFKDIQEATNLLSSENNQTRIDYFITIPSHINLKIINRYGNIFIPDYQGNLNIQLANGDFQARKLKGNNNIDLAFGNAFFELFNQGYLKLNFVETTIDKCDQLDMESKSSQIKIKQSNLIKLKSKRDDITISNTNSLFGDSYFSKLSILNSVDEFNMIMQYGELINLSMADNFKLLKLTSEYCNSTIIMGSNIKPYTCNITAPKSEVILPSNLKPNIKEWHEQIQTEPVSFSYINESSKEKAIIKITNATLKIIHK